MPNKLKVLIALSILFPPFGFIMAVMFGAVGMSKEARHVSTNDH